MSRTEITQPYKQARAELLQELIKIHVCISPYQLYMITLYSIRLRQCSAARPRLLVQLQRAMEHPLSKLPSGSDFSPVVQAISICSKGPFISYLQKFHDCGFFPLPARHCSMVSCGQAEDARKVKSVRKEHCLPTVAPIVAPICFAIH